MRTFSIVLPRLAGDCATEIPAELCQVADETLGQLRGQLKQAVMKR